MGVLVMTSSYFQFQMKLSIIPNQLSIFFEHMHDKPWPYVIAMRAEYIHLSKLYNNYYNLDAECPQRPVC